MKKIILFFLISININAQNNFKKVDSLLALGNYQLALKILENTSNTSFENLEKTGSIYKKIGNYNKSIIVYEKALQFKKSDKINENLGKVYQSSGNSKKAIQLFEKVLKNNQNNLLLKYHLAKLYFKKRTFKKAKLLFTDLIRNDVNNPNYYYYLGRIYENEEEIHSAKKQFLKVLKLDSLHIKTYYKLAKLYRKENNKDSTNFYLKKGIIIRPNNILLLQLKTKVTYSNKVYKSVIFSVKKLDSLHASSKYYDHLLAYSYYYSKEYKKAEEVLLNLLYSKKANDKTLFYLGLIYNKLKKYELANDYFLMSIQQQTPDLSLHYYELGLIALKINNAKSALENFKKSSENKINYSALYQLATLSEHYYKDKNIALEHYKVYLNLFEHKSKQKTLFIKQQIRKITTDLFMQKTSN